MSESDQQVSQPLFAALSGASSKPALDVEEQVDQLHLEAEKQATQAKGLSVPGEMDAAQRDLLLALDLRAEGVEKVANLVRTALGGQAKQASTHDRRRHGELPGLRRDLLPAGRAADRTDAEGRRRPRADRRQHALPAEHRLAGTEHGAARITGQAASSPNGAVTGNHGSALKGVSVGATTLEAGTDAQPHQRRRQPDVHRAGRKLRRIPRDERQGGRHRHRRRQAVRGLAYDRQNRTRQDRQRRHPGDGVPLGAASKIEVKVEPVPGENDTENNKGTYLAIFGS